MGIFGTKQQELEFAEGITVQNALFARARLGDLVIKSQRLYLSKLADVHGQKGVTAADSSRGQADELKARYDLYLSARQQHEFVCDLVDRFEVTLGELPRIVLPELIG